MFICNRFIPHVTFLLQNVDFRRLFKNFFICLYISKVNLFFSTPISWKRKNRLNINVLSCLTAIDRPQIWVASLNTSPLCTDVDWPWLSWGRPVSRGVFWAWAWWWVCPCCALCCQTPTVWASVSPACPPPCVYGPALCPLNRPPYTNRNYRSGRRFSINFILRILST